MQYRYCPDCQQWWSNRRYEFDDVGWIVCPDCGMSLHGLADESVSTEHALRSNLRVSHPSKDLTSEVEAARRQGLID